MSEGCPHSAGPPCRSCRQHRGSARAIALLGLLAVGCGGPSTPEAETVTSPEPVTQPEPASDGNELIEIRAIYGMPMTPERERRAGWIDKDGDGFDQTNDCDDNNADIYPCMPDSEGDGVDSNCDGVDGVKPDNGQDCP
ncbi:MAG: putative metal-binding motif-containing protein [Proteobacteria bacterium]|nr:putative metal-binding motif-containing protein [Pseudomonadota bacterium]